MFERFFCYQKVFISTFLVKKCINIKLGLKTLLFRYNDPIRFQIKKKKNGGGQNAG